MPASRRPCGGFEGVLGEFAGGGGGFDALAGGVDLPGGVVGLDEDGLFEALEIDQGAHGLQLGGLQIAGAGAVRDRDAEDGADVPGGIAVARTRDRGETLEARLVSMPLMPKLPTRSRRGRA